jgi:tRNA nucleotidyltransferase (CCA-adding enzyme)
LEKIVKIYVTGGAVRDVLLGRTPKDIDYVVVGSTPAQMLANGFIRVGADFPVFLKDGEEYALARTERKTAPGYNGFETNFDPSITLFQDLKRRDLTINSMAVSVENWENFKLVASKGQCPTTLIDPFGGFVNLDQGVLVHTSEAFCEDPIRVLRTARFASRYNFQVSDSTMALMKKIVHELNAVAPERIWLEFSKGLMEDHPAVMIDVLGAVDAFDVDVMKPYNSTQAVRYFTRMKVLDTSAELENMSLDERFALMPSNFANVGQYKSLCIPVSCSALDSMLTEFGAQLSVFDKLPAADRLSVLNNFRLNSVQGVEFINKVLKVLRAMYRSNGLEKAIQRITTDIQSINAIDFESIATQCQSGKEIKEKIQQAKLAAIINNQEI